MISRTLGVIIGIIVASTALFLFLTKEIPEKEIPQAENKSINEHVEGRITEHKEETDLKASAKQETNNYPAPPPSPDLATSDTEVITENAPQSMMDFWYPFKSEYSAQGFATTIKKQTDIDIQVVQKSSSSFIVAFAYKDEGERLSLLNLIESKTGLEIKKEQLP